MKTVGISILGTTLDRRGKKEKRWDKWRPTITLCQQEDLVLDRLELLLQPQHQKLADELTADIKVISPETEVVHHHVNFEDPWDFEAVFGDLYDFAQQYNFRREKEQYLIHITTGTHVAQICLFLLTEAHYLPGKLIQTSPAADRGNGTGEYQIIDLDLSRYDQIASRFSIEHQEGTTYLKSGIETNSKTFNALIEQLEKVSVRSQEPILLAGPTGAGKSQLAKRIYELKKLRGQIKGKLVSVNCATLRGDNAMSALFGHSKGAFTGAATARAGLLQEADGGLLFLDEIGELGLDEQAMLLHAIEEKQFFPFGSDKEVKSDFQLISGTNRDLAKSLAQGQFREDLLARINLWAYTLPSLKERIEDLEPNLDYELQQFAHKANHLVSFNKAARNVYLKFAKSPEAVWTANFRDLNSSIKRMATLAEGGRISEAIVKDEIARLKTYWQSSPDALSTSGVQALLGDRANSLDLFDLIQLEGIAKVCKQSQSMAEAGRKLFNYSRTQKSSVNDSHRVKQILERYGLSFGELQ